jgi:hypothetical protein
MCEVFKGSYCGAGWGMGTAMTATVLSALSAGLILLARDGESIPAPRNEHLFSCRT